MRIDKGPAITNADSNQFKADAIRVAATLNFIRTTLSKDDQAAIKRFWRYLEADAFIPPRYID